MISEAALQELLDFASVYGEFDETTPIGTISTHKTALTNEQRGAIIAYKKTLGLLPADAVIADMDDPTCWHCGNGHLSAQASLLLIAGNRVASYDAMRWIHDTAYEAGPQFCAEIIERLNPSDEVPF